MKVVITTNQLALYGGSEIVALEIAEYFASQGNSVLIFTNYYAGPIKDHTQAPKYKKAYPTLTITDDWNIVIDRSQVDLLWVQHQLIPPTLIQMFSTITRKKPYVVFHHMSSVVPLETPFLKGVEAVLADRIFAVSENTKKSISNYFNKAQKIEVFPNPAPSAFASKVKKISGKIRRVAIVSNHPPKELLQTATLLRRKKILIDIYGLQHKHLRITPQILHKYDVVITIGKTVQYCLCMGIPVYVYDHYGGPGYLSRDNYMLSSSRNFCGKDGVIKTPKTIVEEIFENYKGALVFQKANLKYFHKIFILDSRLQRLLRMRPRKKKLSKKFAISAEKTLLNIRKQHLIAEKKLLENGKRKTSASRKKSTHKKITIRANITNLLGLITKRPLWSLRDALAEPVVSEVEPWQSQNV